MIIFSQGGEDLKKFLDYTQKIKTNWFCGMEGGPVVFNPAFPKLTAKEVARMCKENKKKLAERTKEIDIERKQYDCKTGYFEDKPKTKSRKKPTPKKKNKK